jgi:hypothetical protein
MAKIVAKRGVDERAGFVVMNTLARNTSKAG